MMNKLRVGLYGNNGHQIQSLLESHPLAELAAFASIDPAAMPAALQHEPGVRIYASLAELLQDRSVDLISLCSPRRADQANDAIACLRAGKHVYAEKPCALSEAELDDILAVAGQTGREFHEMAGTIFTAPLLAVRETVRSGKLGTVVQVFVQKSYPYHDQRPQDEAIDGGLIAQCAIHGVRMIEQLTGLQTVRVAGFETRLGNPRPGDLRMAAVLSFELENHGCAAIIANYLNPRGTGLWGNDEVRIFGTAGMVEATADCQETRLVVGAEPPTRLVHGTPADDYFTRIVRHLLGQGSLPFTQEEEFHPTRVVLRAKGAAVQLGI